MRLRRWTGRAAVALSVAILPLGAQLNAWAAARDGLIRTGSAAAPTAQYVMAEDGQSLLAPGSDPRLRVIVDGDLATARHVAVVIPGVDTYPEVFDSALAGRARFAADGSGEVARESREPIEWWKTTPGWARSLRLAAGEVARGGRDDLAVVAWLGYNTPAGWTGATPNAMEEGAANLVAFDRFLTDARPDADVTWICHSYGSLVCASALVEVDPDALILVGSPGVSVRAAADLATTAPVWAGQGGEDLIGLTQLVGFFGGSFGVRPASSAFGALELPCDPADGHSDYFRPGSPQVRAMAAIALGDRPV
jgi:hypothetical protein